jgi:hypothetical protein
MDDLVGLVFIDWLQVTPGQWVALILHAGGWLWVFYSIRVWREDRPIRTWLFPAVLTLNGLWVAFWNAMTCVDEWLLFKQARLLSSCGWHVFLEDLAQRPYVEYQPPFLTFWFSRLPVLWWHQLLWFPWAVLCAGLMWRLYGRPAALLLATPVFALMIHQPCHDVLLFGALLIVLRLRQLSGVRRCCRSRIGDSAIQRCALKQRLLCTPYILLAAFVYGLTWMIKPLTIVTLPFILPQLGLAGLVSLTMWGGYLRWSWQYEFGRHQLRFLLHQLLIRRMKKPTDGAKSHMPLPLSAILRKKIRRLWNTLGWRWEHLGRKAVKALPFYLFPAYLRPWVWQGIVLAVIIVIDYGNIKYLLLDLLFLFPVREEE